VMTANLYRAAVWISMSLTLVMGCASKGNLVNVYASALEDQRQNNRNEARQGYRELLKKRANLAGVHNNYARLELSYGRIETALVHFLKERRHHPDVAAAWSNHLLLLGATKQYAKAKEFIGDALKRFPNDAAVHLAHSLILLRTGGTLEDIEQALRTSMASKKKALRAMAYFVRGLLRSRDGRHQDAADAFDHVTRLRRDGDARYNRAVSLWLAGRLKAALAEITLAERLNPKEVALPALEAIIHLQLNNLPRADAALSRGRDLAKADVRLDFIEGLLHLRRRAHKRSAAAFLRAVRAKPKWPAAHFNLGLAYVGLNRLAKAREHFGTAMTLDPRDKDAARNWKTLGDLVSP
jgi:tetratricopeptide (TPR) repeat protein